MKILEILIWFKDLIDGRPSLSIWPSELGVFKCITGEYVLACGFNKSNCGIPKMQFLVKDESKARTGCHKFTLGFLFIDTCCTLPGTNFKLMPVYQKGGWKIPKKVLKMWGKVCCWTLSMVSALIRGIRARLPSQWRAVSFIAILLFRPAAHSSASPANYFLSLLDFFWPLAIVAQRPYPLEQTPTHRQCFRPQNSIIHELWND